MAAYLNYIELFKIFIERGADFHCKDKNLLSPILYCSKANNMSLFFILLYLGAPINDCDKVGCNISHFAAFKNNKFLLEFLNTMGCDLFQADNVGLTPFKRAITNYSYQAVEYLAKLNPSAVPRNLDLIAGHSKSMQYILGKVIDK
jgi:ankyrin repeat protein